jgi:hypothetical protein
MMPRFEHAPRESLERLHPGYFALMMATGILALGARLQRLAWIAEILFWLNALFLTARSFCGLSALRARCARICAITGVLWALSMYGILAALTVKSPKPDVQHRLNGSWLVSVVATQAVAVLTVFVLSAGGLPQLRAQMMFLAMTFWLGGGAIYLCLMALIFFRYTFIEMSPEDLSPPTGST